MADILFLAHRAPWPPDRGDRIRSWHVFQALARLGRVHVAALADHDADADTARTRLAPLTASLYIGVRYRDRLTAMLRALRRGEPASLALFHHAGLAAHVGGLLASGQISHIVGFSGQMGQYLPPPQAFAGPVVMDFVDVDSAKFADYARAETRFPMGWAHAREARLLGDYEVELARRVDASLFVSAAEAALFRARCDDPAVTVAALENGIDTDFYDPAAGIDRAPAAPAAPLIVFTGQMDYRPNIEAADWFARAILPAVRRAVPDAHFAIVGRAPAPAVPALRRAAGGYRDGRSARCAPVAGRRRCGRRAIADRARHSEQGAGGDGDGPRRHGHPGGSGRH